MQILPFDLEQAGQGQLSIGLVHFMLVSLHACDIANLLSSPTQTYHFLYRMDQTSCLSQAFVVLPNWLSQVRVLTETSSQVSQCILVITFDLTKLYWCFRTHFQISSESVQVVGNFTSYTQHATISAGHDRWELSFCGLDLSQGRVGRRRFCESHRWGRGCSIGMTPSPNPRTILLSKCKWKSSASHVPCSLGFFWFFWT